MSSDCAHGLSQDNVSKDIWGYFLPSFYLCKGFYPCVCNAFHVWQRVAICVHDLRNGPQISLGFASWRIDAQGCKFFPPVDGGMLCLLCEVQKVSRKGFFEAVSEQGKIAFKRSFTTYDFLLEGKRCLTLVVVQR